MPTVHMIHGFLCAGKTTFAKRLERELPAVRYSIDEWLVTLADTDGPVEHLDERLLEGLRELMNRHWPQAIRAAVDVVLDFGFWTRAWREEVRRIAAEAGADARLYDIQCSDETALRRLRERNREPGDSFSLTDAAYEALRERFDPLGPDEPHELVNTG